MSLYLIDLRTAADDRLSRVPLSELAIRRGIPPSKLRMLQRYFRLESIFEHEGDLSSMLRQPLFDLVAAHEDLRIKSGLLVYARTQTHMTHACEDWLRLLAHEAGLSSWDVMVQTQTHCAGGLAAVELVKDLEKPVILLVGEKAFHPITSTQSGAALGEAPVAVLFRAGTSDNGWKIAHSRTHHMPEFNANPYQMAPDLRKHWEKNFGRFIERFLTNSLGEFNLAAHEIDLVVPYNLNLPLLEAVTRKLGWEACTYTELLSTAGHLFCADVYYNLTQVLPQTQASRILCFAAGMGATFSTIVLEKV